MIGILILSILVRSVVSACSAAGPISLPVTNVLLSNNYVMRGIPMTVGTPPQNISFMPHDFLNDTWIYNSTDGFCSGNVTQNFCITYRGGLYNPSGSSTSKAASSVDGTGGDPSDVQRSLGTHLWDSGWVNDDLSFGNISFPSFPIGMPPYDYGGSFDTQNNIGMGINSTILTALQAAGKIASQSYSWWWGQTGAIEDIQMDGSIVFGGYDKAKTLGDNYTQQLKSPTVNCESGMQVQITDLVLNFPNGTNSSIMNPNQALGCLQPDFTTLMTILQSPYYDTFELYTGTKSIGRGGGNGIDSRGMLYFPGQVYSGSLTIELNSVFSVEIPNDLLVVPPSNVASDGSIFTNTSVLEVMLDPTGGANQQDPLILGRPFFSAAYLNVDYDAGTFSLWRANPTEETDLVALGGDCSSPEVNAPANNITTNNATSSGPSGSNGTQSSNGAKATNTRTHLSTGVIVGAVVGSAFGTAALTVTAILLYIRWRKRGGELVKVANPDSSTSPTPRGHAAAHDDVDGPRYNEAMTHEVLEMGAERAPGELAAESKPVEVYTTKPAWDRFASAHSNSPIELG